MQKYKIVASKSQKKYNIIVSADSPQQAKEKLHKEGYSILSIGAVSSKDIEGQKFIFQVETNGEIKNGVIVGTDIFKVYVKLKDELGYHVLFLYPEGDEAHTNAEKKQLIMNELQKGYELQKQKTKIKQEKKESQDNFYLKKKLDEAHLLIEKVIEKIDILFLKKSQYNIDKNTFVKLEKIYEKLIHIKGSTNLSKLKQIGELALIKIGEIELYSIEHEKSEESRKLLSDTNALLKQIGSDKHFIEKNKDIKKIFSHIASQIFNVFSFKTLKSNYIEKKSKRDTLIDTKSYSFLKTSLLLEKYQEKLNNNSKEIRKSITLFLNPFNHSDKKEKLLLKRKVIKQNISILKAKNTGKLHSYTGVKKGYHKFIENLLNTVSFFKNIIFFCIVIYSFIFYIGVSYPQIIENVTLIQIQIGIRFLLFFLVFILLSFSKNIVLLLINIVFFIFIFIFSTVNF